MDGPTTSPFNSDLIFILPENITFSTNIKTLQEKIEQQWESNYPAVLALYPKDPKRPTDYSCSFMQDLRTQGIDPNKTKTMWYIVFHSKKNNCLESVYCGQSLESKPALKQFTLNVCHAAMGIRKAIYEIGLCLKSEGSKSNIRIAKKLFKMNVNSRPHPEATLGLRQVHGNSVYHLGDIYKNSNLKKMFNLFHHAAQYDIKEAQNELGLICIKETSIVGHKEKAFFWFKAAALEGSPEAQFHLAECYQKGDGTKVNEQLACIWYIFAAENKHDPALKVLHNWKENQLGQAYYHAALFLLMTEEKMEKSLDILSLMNKAISFGCPIDDETIDILYADDKEIITYKKDAFFHFEEAALQGDVKAQASLAECYRRECGAKLNNHLACMWYILAAENGWLSAAQILNTLEKEQLAKGYYDAALFVNDQPAVTANPQHPLDFIRKSIAYGYPVTEDIKFEIENNCFLKNFQDFSNGQDVESIDQMD